MPLNSTHLNYRNEKQGQVEEVHSHFPFYSTLSLQRNWWTYGRLEICWSSRTFRIAGPPQVCVSQLVHKPSNGCLFSTVRNRTFEEPLLANGQIKTLCRPKKAPMLGQNMTRTHTHTQPSSHSCFWHEHFQVSQWEALLKELAWDGSYTQKRLWPRTGTAGVIATKLQQAIFLMLKESTQLRTCCGSCRMVGWSRWFKPIQNYLKEDHVSFFPWMHPHPKKGTSFFFPTFS